MFTQKQNTSMDSGGSRSSSSSLSSSNNSMYKTGDAVRLADCEGAQPYLFEPYNRGASSGTDRTNDSDQDQFERLQITGW